MTSNAKNSLDAVTDSISSKLKRLPSKHIALFSVCVAERLAGFYEVFARKHNHGDCSLIRDALDAVWRFLIDGCSAQDLRRYLAKVEQATPSSEDYDSLESILAQNLCIVVNSTIQSCLGGQNDELVAGEFGIELLRAAISHAETGFIDVGSGPGSKEFEENLVSHPIIANEIKLQCSDLALLESDPIGTNETKTRLRRSADKNRLDVSRILGS